MPDFVLRQGHVLEELRKMPAESVQCVVTSPPYWGLRNYGTAPQVWDGGEGCIHTWTETTYVRRSNDNKGNRGNEKQRTSVGTIGRDAPIENAFCESCGAWRGELGLELTPELFIKHLVEVF